MVKKNFILFSLLMFLFILPGCKPQKGLQTSEDTIRSIPTSTEFAASPTAVQDVKLEQNDWTTIWIENANQTSLPRILLVGDSITEGYYTKFKKRIEDNYYLGRYTTSKFVANPDFISELSILLHRYHFEVIVLNNGLHGWDYSLDSYQNGLEETLNLLSDIAPETQIIWCQTTPVRLDEDLTLLDPLNRQVVARNQIASEIMGREGIPVIDLYKEMLDHPEYYRNDGMHFNEQGQAYQAELISSYLLNAQ
jgi:hypothetical protein